MFRFNTRNLLIALTMTTSFFLMTSDANAGQFARASSTTVNHTAGAAGVRIPGVGGALSVGGATSVDHEVTRTTPVGTVNRGTNVNTAHGGTAAVGINGAVRGGFSAGSASHTRTAIR